jgi:hypothetical protein
MRLGLILLTLALAAVCQSNADAGEKRDRQPPGVIVHFEGGIVGLNIAKVLSIANSSESIPTYRYQPADNDTLCGILASAGYPPPCEGLADFVGKLNNNPALTAGKFEKGKEILLPSVNLARYRSAQTFSNKVQREVSRSNSLTESWTGLNLQPSQRTKNLYEIEYDAFEIFIPTSSDVSATSIASQILQLNTTNVLVDVLRVKPPSSTLQSVVSLDDLKASCNGTSALSAIYDYVELSDYDRDAVAIMRQGLRAASPQRERARVVVIDVPLLGAPNFYPAYKESLQNLNWLCKWDTFRTGLHHSTHLAGIVGSQDRFGFRGLGQNATIESFVWEKPKSDQPDETEPADPDRHTNLADRIAETAPEIPLPIYLAATTFDPWDFGLDANGLLLNANARFQRILENRIRGRRPLLVVAAGQAKSVTSKGVELTPSRPMSPQNLGDLPNVLVVTACEVCTRTQTRLLASANFGSGDRNFVHVIAPGGTPIPGWISDSAVGAGAGTSQAAAYVAGMAAAMVSNFPNAYAEASLVKARIQITSRPLSASDDGSENPDSGKVNAGLVDPVLALLNPRKHWIKQSGAWKELKIKSLSNAPLSIRGIGGSSFVKTTHIKRIVRTSIPPASPQWTLYLDRSLARPDVAEDEVQRVGPIQAGARSEIFVPCGASTGVRFDDIEDIIISIGGFRPDDCQVN